MKDRSKIHRLYAPALSAVGAGPLPAEVALPPGEVHHARHVLRLREGDEVEAFDGAGRRASARVRRAGRSEMTVVVEAFFPMAEPLSPRIHLAFAVPKGDRLGWLLEKAAELGAASLQPIVFERSLAGREELSPAKRRRWEMACIAAAKQCGLDYLPAFREPAALTAFLAAPARPLALVGDLSDDARPLRDVLPPSAADITVLVGPEGGFTGAESAGIRQAAFIPVRLGQTTLRIETAALALLAAIRGRML